MNARRDITVRHPKYGSTTVKAARDKLDAVTEAARRWGAQWSTVARECTFEEEVCRPTAPSAREEGAAT